MLKRLVMAIGTLSLAALIAACSPPLTAEEEATPTPIPTPIVPDKPMYEVKRGEVVDNEDFLCRVAPEREEQLSFKMSGRVATVNVEKGDEVKAGDILAELEVQDLMNQVDQGRVDLEKAQISLAQAQVEVDNKLAVARRDLEIAQVRLDQAVQGQQYSVAQAATELDNARIRLAQAQANDPALALKEAEGVLAKAEGALREAQIAYADAAQDPSKSAAAQEAYRSALLDYDLAQARFESAKAAATNATYNTAILQNAVQTAELNLQRVQSGADPLLQKNLEAAQREVQSLEQGVDPLLEKNVETAQLRLDRLAAQLSAAQIVAPFDGVVTGVLAFEGREAQDRKPVIVIAEPGSVELSCDLTSSVLDKLSEGMPATIIFSDRPGETLSGSIRLLPYPYGGGGVRSDAATQEDKSTRIAFDPGQGEGLDPGQLAKVSVTIEKRENTLYLPPQAIRTFEGRRFVVVQDAEGRQQRLDVKLGISGDDRVEILEGVEEGQSIVGP